MRRVKLTFCSCLFSQGPTDFGELGKNLRIQAKGKGRGLLLNNIKKKGELLKVLLACRDKLEKIRKAKILMKEERQNWLNNMLLLFLQDIC